MVLVAIASGTMILGILAAVAYYLFRDIARFYELWNEPWSVADED